ncbi:MAG: E3 ubiquitin ligase family protein [Acidobacteriia bacterium]|nr:E3 ubiquitin ligase family protein [Terriglobia bacterium]
MLLGDDRVYAYSALGFGIGILLFFKGFRKFRKYRVLADTPEVPIRSVPMGLVEIHGTALGDDKLASPVSHTPCYLYKVQIDRWKEDSKGRGGWVHHRTDIERVKFYLQDKTGKVLVDPGDAELDLPEYAQRKIGEGRTSSGGRGATESELRNYVTQADVHRLSGFVERALEHVGPRSDPKQEETRQSLVEAFQHTPGFPDFQQRIAGLMASKLQQRLQEIGPQPDPQKEQARLAALEAFKHPRGSPEYGEQMRRAVVFAPSWGQQEFLEAMGVATSNAPATLLNFPQASGRYRFTEYCIVPGRSYDITGTCTENPNPRDEDDRNMIVKGQNEPTFLISSKTEKQLESDLRSRAQLMIVGGAILSIVCLAIFLAKLGLF